MSDIHYQQGFSDDLRTQAAQLYDEAFSSKLSAAIPDQDARLRLLEQAFRPEYAITAIENGELVGLLGFFGEQGGLAHGLMGGSGMGWGDFRKVLGPLATARAFSVYALGNILFNQPQQGELLIEGIAVRGDMRGRGVGGQLLEHLARYAREQDYTHLCLDVIDTNVGARKLYERKGFETTKTVRFGALWPLLGFSAIIVMQQRLHTP